MKRLQRGAEPKAAGGWVTSGGAQNSLESLSPGNLGMGDPWTGQEHLMCKQLCCPCRQKQSCASTELLLLVQGFHLHSMAQMGGKSPGTGIWVCGWLGVSNQPPLLGDVEKGEGLKWEGTPSPTQVLPKEPGCAPSPPQTTEISPAPPAPAPRAARASLPATTTAWLGTESSCLPWEM